MNKKTIQPMAEMKRIFFISTIAALIAFSGCAKKGEHVTSTGVRYTVIKEGTGAAPERGDSVTVITQAGLKMGKNSTARLTATGRSHSGSASARLFKDGTTALPQ